MSESNYSYFSKEFIDKVQYSVDFGAIVSQYTSLKSVGNKLVGYCPFHQEKHPSFNVDVQKGLFYCFGCGKGGDIFQFIMEIESLTFPEAVKHLANKAGLEIPRVAEKQRKQATEFEQYFNITATAKQYFRRYLLSSKGSEARDYLKSRNLSEEILEQFEIGLAGPGWQELFNFLLQEEKVKPNILLKLDLIRQSSAGKYYDTFRDRIIFPIMSPSGETVGFGGRIYRATDDVEVAKYINSSNTPLYKKKEILYGLNDTRRYIQKANCAFLVEGYTDLISFWSKGIKNIAATCGTALTTAQAQILRRYAKEIIIIYDGDDAGQKATLRAMPILLSTGLDIKVFPISSGSDPDSFIQSAGATEFQKTLQKIPTWFEFALNHLRKNVGEDSSKQLENIATGFGPFINALDSPILKATYVKELSDELNLPYEALQPIIRRNRGHYNVQDREELREHGEKEFSKSDQLELDFISVLIFDNSFIKKIPEEDDLPSFFKSFPGILSKLLDAYAKYSSISMNTITEYLTTTEMRNYIAKKIFKLSAAINSEDIDDMTQQPKKAKIDIEANFWGLFNKLKLIYICDRIEALMLQKNQAEQKNAQKKVAEICRELSRLQKLKYELRKLA